MPGPLDQLRWDPFRELEREVGRLFGSLDPLAVRSTRPFPAINLYDAKDKFIVSAELPGVEADEIELALTGETITLRGNRKRSSEVADESFRRQERFFGQWARTVTLPERVNGTEVSADFAHGILTISLPKVEEAKPRQIAVKTSTTS
jgi:HSP20 family protein